MMKIREPNENEECQDCNYYDKVTGFCGVCMKKILRELKEGDNRDDDRQN